MIKNISVKFLEEVIFGKISKFKLHQYQEKEMYKNLKKSKILISGSAVSIGKAFSLKLKKYDISKIIFLDKDENALTELNREINISFKNKIKRDYICQDINDIDISEILKKEKITHFLNFAALKHVRSEENFYSLKYLIKTNCVSPFKLGDLSKRNDLSGIFN